MQRSTGYIGHTCPEIDHASANYARQAAQIIEEMTELFKELGTIPMREAFERAIDDAEGEIEERDRKIEELREEIDRLEIENAQLKDQIADLTAERMETPC